MAHITKLLRQRWDSGNLPNASIINSGDVDQTLEKVKGVASYILQSVNLLTHPDFMLIMPDGSTSSKVININQIRKLHAFLNTTSFKNKVVIISNAQAMNINAANSCLKILEETDDYIFLLTNNTYRLPITIRSRCYKIFDYATTRQPFTTYSQVIGFAQPSANIEDLLAFFEKTREDPSLWEDFINSCLLLLNRLTKYVAGVEIQLNDDEQSLFKQFDVVNTRKLIEKFEYITYLRQQTAKCFLDKKQVLVLIIERLRAGM